MAKEINLNIAGHSIKLSMDDFEKANKSFPKQLDAEGKEINMAMTVDTSAEYATNAREYFRKAMIGEESTRKRFRPLLGVKDRVKLGTVDMTGVAVKAGDCKFDPDDTVIKQKEYVVAPLMLGTTFCVRSLEIGFMSDQLAKGSNNFNSQFEFMNYFYSELERWVEDQMEKITFTGTVALNGVDGLETLLTADTDVIKPTAGNGGVASAIDDTNVIAKFKQARDNLTAAVRDMSDFVYIVSDNVYLALADAVSDNKASGLYYIEGDVLKFQGKEVYKGRGMSDDTIIATYWSNLVNIQDLLDEELGFNIVDFMGTTLDREIGVRVDFKYQPSYVNPEEIYFHTL